MKEDFLRITDYSFESLSNSGIDTATIKNLPEKAVVVDVGSGIQQEFAKSVKGIRPDVLVVSLDPSLGIDPKEKGWHLGESGDAIYYIKENSTPDDDAFFKVFQTQRLQSALKNSAVAGKAPELPIAPNSVDLLVDSGGAARFIRDKDTFKVYLVSVDRVMKHGGRAVITDIACISNAYTDPFWNKKSIEELKEITQDILKDCTLEFTDDGQNRGVVISKNSTT